MDGQKCERVQCTCYLDLGMDYCGSRCRDAARADPQADPHSPCGCRHAECENDG